MNLYLVPPFIIAIYLLGNLGGYVVHKLLHQKWSGRAYHDHANHHYIIYPPNDYLSDVYREPPIEAGQAKYYLTFFLLAFSPLILWHWGFFAIAFVESVLVLKVNSVVHDAIHVRGHRWERYQWFHRLRNTHFAHHVDVTRNFGIFSFIGDHLCGTFSLNKEGQRYKW